MSRWSAFTCDELCTLATALLDVGHGVTPWIDGEIEKAVVQRMFAFYNGRAEFKADRKRWLNFSVPEMMAVLNAVKLWDARGFYQSNLNFTARAVVDKVQMMAAIAAQVIAAIKEIRET